MNKLFASISIIASASIVLVGGTLAVFTTPPEFAHNQKLEGSKLNLQVDYGFGSLRCTIEGVAAGVGNGCNTPLIFLDTAKPGDNGTLREGVVGRPKTLQVYNVGSIPGKLYMKAINLIPSGVCTEPEVNDDVSNRDDCSIVGDTEDNSGPGHHNELADEVSITISDGTLTKTGTVSELASQAGQFAGYFDLPVTPGANGKPLSITYDIPGTVGNEIMDDKLLFSLQFTLVQ